MRRFGGLQKLPTFALAIERDRLGNAEVAQLVEHNLAKVRVAGSSPVFRSNYIASYYFKPRLIFGFARLFCIPISRRGSTAHPIYALANRPGQIEAHPINQGD